MATINSPNRILERRLRSRSERWLGVFYSADRGKIVSGYSLDNLTGLHLDNVTWLR